MATIRRIPAVENHFQLVITRVYEEGDQELLEDEDESVFYSNSIHNLASDFETGKPTRSESF